MYREICNIHHRFKGGWMPLHIWLGLCMGLALAWFCRYLVKWFVVEVVERGQFVQKDFLVNFRWSCSINIFWFTVGGFQISNLKTCSVTCCHDSMQGIISWWLLQRLCHCACLQHLEGGGGGGVWHSLTPLSKQPQLSYNLDPSSYADVRELEGIWHNCHTNSRFLICS